jgi:hypothetical protein
MERLFLDWGTPHVYARASVDAAGAEATPDAALRVGAAVDVTDEQLTWSAATLRVGVVAAVNVAKSGETTYTVVVRPGDEHEPLGEARARWLAARVAARERTAKKAELRHRIWVDAGGGACDGNGGSAGGGGRGRSVALAELRSARLERVPAAQLRRRVDSFATWTAALRRSCLDVYVPGGEDDVTVDAALNRALLPAEALWAAHMALLTAPPHECAALTLCFVEAGVAPVPYAAAAAAAAASAGMSRGAALLPDLAPLWPHLQAGHKFTRTPLRLCASVALCARRDVADPAALLAECGDAVARWSESRLNRDLARVAAAGKITAAEYDETRDASAIFFAKTGVDAFESSAGVEQRASRVRRSDSESALEQVRRHFFCLRPFFCLLSLFCASPCITAGEVDRSRDDWRGLCSRGACASAKPPALRRALRRARVTDAPVAAAASHSASTRSLPAPLRLNRPLTMATGSRCRGRTATRRAPPRSRRTRRASARSTAAVSSAPRRGSPHRV